MTAIWARAEQSWQLLAPVGFPDEAALHGLVEDAPQILPLAGAPQLVILGREVSLGGNSADLVAVETGGRLCVVEIKLGHSAEARRAVVAQVLTYAAFLAGLSLETLERAVLGRHLRERGYESIAEAVSQNDQQGEIDRVEFESALSRSLETGEFRLVLVLDSAPAELVRLAAYFGHVADRVLIDLITVSAYQAGDTQVMVPHRVEPQRWPRLVESGVAASPEREVLAEGTDLFERAILDKPEADRPLLRRLVSWATDLENEGLVRLHCYQGRRYTTLLPRLQPESVGLVTIAVQGRPLWFFRSVWERHAPALIGPAERLMGIERMGQGTAILPTEELLALVRDAYRVARGRAIA